MVKGKESIKKAISDEISAGSTDLVFTTLDMYGNEEYVTEVGRFLLNVKDEGEIDQFINFAMTPRDQLPVEFLIDVYRQYYNKGANAPSSENIQAVTDTQAMPRSAGVLQGGEPKVKSELDVSWDRILKAGNAGRLL